jgi:phage terminase small subunit
MNLTHKQEAFCQAIANGMNKSDAYRSAYDAGKMKPDVVNVKASQLAAVGKVAVRLTELKQSLSEKSEWTRLDSVTALRNVVEGSEAKPSDITGAVKVLNEMHGYNAPREINVNGSLSLNVSFD